MLCLTGGHIAVEIAEFQALGLLKDVPFHIPTFAFIFLIECISNLLAQLIQVDAQVAKTWVIQLC